MQFLASVPKEVRVDMIERLEGRAGRPGWLAALAETESELAALRAGPQPQPSEADAHRRAVARAEQQVAELRAIVACAQRLANDGRMAPVYASLPASELVAFISAAWQAEQDYGRQREQMRAAREWAHEVAKAAGKLAELLHNPASLPWCNLPGELFDLPALLEATERPGTHRDARLWPSMRAAILGANEAIGEETQGALRYAWATAPEVHELVETVQRVAGTYTPEPLGIDGAALASRQSNPVMDYLRALAHLLQGAGVDLCDGVAEAMAVAAEVVLNAPERIATKQQAVTAIRVIEARKLA